MFKHLRLYALFFGILMISASYTIASPPVTEEEFKDSPVILR